MPRPIVEKDKKTGATLSDDPHHHLVRSCVNYSAAYQSVNPVKPKSIVYIDGYNWYHAIFKHRPEWKWLDIQRFFEVLTPHEDVVKVKMFSAYVQQDTAARERQERYFRALETLPKVKIILGVFQLREVMCRATCKEKYAFPEEKKTDVNMAVETMSDATSSSCERMHIVSGDSDFQPAVEWVAKNLPAIKLCVWIPALPTDRANRRTDYYRTRGLPVGCDFLPLGPIKDCQLRGVVRLAGGQFAPRPHIWKDTRDTPS